jgi:hypothetical protein
MQDAGLGHRFVAFARTSHGERTVEDCRLFRDSPGPRSLARFQHVRTRPQWRRRGLCSALVHKVGRRGLEVMGAKTLVMLADPQDVTFGFDETRGFERAGETCGLQRRPPASGRCTSRATLTDPDRP